MVVRSLLRGAAGSYLGSTWARPPRLGGVGARSSGTPKTIPLPGSQVSEPVFSHHIPGASKSLTRAGH